MYERALLLYVEYPGRHEKVAAALSTPEKSCTAGQCRRLYTHGLPDFDLPPIADALRDHVRASLGGQPGYDLATGKPVEATPVASTDPALTAAASVTLNALTPRERRKVRAQAAEAEARERSAKSEYEVRRIEAEAKRAEAQAEASRQQTELERAKTERLKAETALAARKAAAGLTTPGELNLVERRAQEAGLVASTREQLKAVAVIMRSTMFALANEGLKVANTLKGRDLTFEQYTAMTRSAMASMKDASAVVESTVKLERLIFGEPTERVEVTTVGGEDPIAVLMGGIEALKAAAARGVIDIDAEDSIKIAALETDL
jgi:hypothetical protein